MWLSWAHEESSCITQELVGRMVDPPQTMQYSPRCIALLQNQAKPQKSGAGGEKQGQTEIVLTEFQLSCFQALALSQESKGGLSDTSSRFDGSRFPAASGQLPSAAGK